MRRGKVRERLDVNYWFSSGLYEDLYATPQYPLVPLRRLVTLVQYGISERATSEPIGTPILRMNNLQAHGWDLTDLKYIQLDPETEAQFLVKNGDILFNRTNSKELVGKCEVFQEDGSWVFASYLIRVRLNESEALPNFVADFLNTDAGRVQIDRVSRQIIGMSNVNAEELRDLLIPTPPPDIQRALVAEMEAARESRRAKLNQADELLKSLDGWLLAQLGLEPPPTDDRKVFAVRLGYAQGRFDSQFHLPRFQKILETIKRIQHYPLGSLATFSHEVWNQTEAIDRGDITFRYIEISGVNRETGEARAEEVLITEAPSRARMLVEEGDIIISLTRPHHGSIAQIDISLNGCIASTGFAVVRNLDETRITADYLWSMLRTQLCLQQMLQRSSGGNYPAITEDELAKILVPVPDLSTQAIIAIEVHRRRAEVSRLRAEAEAEWQAAKECFEHQLLAGGAT